MEKGLKNSLQIQLLCFLLCLFSASGIRAASYDHLQLVYAWPNTFCLDRNVACKNPVPQKFVLHGLWPSDKSGKPLAYCHKTANVSWALSKYEKQLSSSWPSLRRDLTNMKFWQYQWEKHRTCALSRMNVLGYLQLIITTQRNLDPLMALRANNIKPNGYRTPWNLSRMP
ncbi:ribonuclease [Striga asiatica]|uniref:Ribonuclease n=1 Tax=Striga asiatica TaxID=4170 RepID=A0A5A7PT60_STRAF|nr:ribonuclease [Striga asiatica]